MEKGGDSRGGGGLLRGGERAGSDARIHLDIFKLHIGSTIHYWHTHAQTHTHTHTHMHTHAHTHTTIHTRTHKCTLCVYRCTCGGSLARGCANSRPPRCVCMYLYICIYLHIYTYMSAYMCISVYICKFIYCANCQV